MPNPSRALATTIVLATSLVTACVEEIPQATEARCDQRCSFFTDLNTELECEQTFDPDECRAECLEPDPCLAEQQAFNDCRFEQPVESYQCDSGSTGYPQFAVAACIEERDAAFDCVSDNL